MKRKVGVSAVTLRKDEKEKFNKVGKQLEENKLTAVREMTVKFKTSLTEFASKHKDRINSDPEFRQQFHKMCISVGVDPLASNKGFWADILGVGDFYFELGVKIIQVSVQSRGTNGGILSFAEMVQRLNRLDMHRKKSSHSRSDHKISEDDVLRAIDKIAVLGNGFRVLRIGGKSMIVSIPLEISNDATDLMTVAQQHEGLISLRLMTSQYGWLPERFNLAVTPLLSEGILWLDVYNGEVSYYFPSIWKECLLEDLSSDDGSSAKMPSATSSVKSF